MNNIELFFGYLGVLIFPLLVLISLLSIYVYSKIVPLEKYKDKCKRLTIFYIDKGNFNKAKKWFKRYSSRLEYFSKFDNFDEFVKEFNFYEK